MSEIFDEVKKLKYHISLLNRSLDYNKYPIEHLVISMDWSESDLDIVYDIFQKHDYKLKEDSDYSLASFEVELTSTLGISYQGVKLVVNLFYKSGSWVDLCAAYAREFKCMEFHALIDDYSKYNK